MKHILKTTTFLLMFPMVLSAKPYKGCQTNEVREQLQQGEYLLVNTPLKKVPPPKSEQQRLKEAFLKAGIFGGLEIRSLGIEAQIDPDAMLDGEVGLRWNEKEEGGYSLCGGRKAPKMPTIKSLNFRATACSEGSW